jgi:flagellar basal-body rod modification protein FlgD
MSTTIPGMTGMGSADATSSATASNTGLGKDDFLKILMAQMTNMDPMSSSSQDPSQMTQQMTQYSILEQITNLNTTQNSNLMASAHTQALSLIGHQVKYLPTGTDGSAAAAAMTGTVKSVQVGDDGYPTLTIDDKPGVTLGSILEVQ